MTSHYHVWRIHRSSVKTHLSSSRFLSIFETIARKPMGDKMDMRTIERIYGTFGLGFLA
jgi:hypothetical protein